MTDYPDHAESANFDYDDVPEDVRRSAVMSKVKLARCDECGEEVFKLDTAFRNVTFTCDGCGKRLML